DPEVLYNLGNIFLRQNKLSEASRYYEKVLELQPDHVAARNNRGSIHKRRGDYEDALADFEEALRLDPEFAQAHWNRAVVLLLQGDFERGWPEYEWRWTEPWAKCEVRSAKKETCDVRSAKCEVKHKEQSALTSHFAHRTSYLHGRTILLY